MHLANSLNIGQLRPHSIMFIQLVLFINLKFTELGHSSHMLSLVQSSHCKKKKDFEPFTGRVGSESLPSELIRHLTIINC